MMLIILIYSATTCDADTVLQGQLQILRRFRARTAFLRNIGKEVEAQTEQKLDMILK